MQSAGNDDFKETKTILKELESLFSREDIQYDIDDINKMSREINDQTQNIISNNHFHIKQCTAELTQKESEIMAPSQASHAAKVAQKTHDKENVSQQSRKTQDTVAAKQASILAMQEQIKKLDGAIAAINAESATADKRAEYSLHLYNKIANITWDYSAAAGPTSLSGYIASDKAQAFRKFAFEAARPESAAAVDVTNQTWALIESSIAGTSASAGAVV